MITLARIIRIFELAAVLKGGDANDINEKDNKMNSRLIMIFGIGFFAFFIYCVYAFKKFMLPEAASEHGVEIDHLFMVTTYVITLVFFITHSILFWFCYKYYFRAENKALHYSHNDRLEIIWTAIPTVVLTGLIIYGISTWNKVTSPASEESMVVELYAKQFDWTARFSGADNKLGASGFRLIDGTNPLGVDTSDVTSHDDVIVRNEFHLPVNKSVVFKFHSRDVIHSAYMPHFRAQMNCVPGMTTQFHFVPTYTTEQMREKTGNPKFDYLLLCNKICGASHYNMQMNIVVESEADFKKWLAEKKPMYAELSGGDATTTTPAVNAKSVAAPIAGKDSSGTK